MTTLCGGGTSSPKSGAALTIDLTVSAVFAFLLPVIGEVAAGVLAPIIIGLAQLEGPTFCGTDPPADPGLTASIAADAIALPPTLTTFESQHKVLDWFLHQYWFTICQCDTTATPSAPTPSNPGPIAGNPGLPQGNWSKCWDVSIPYFVPAYSGTGNQPVADLSAQGLPSGVPIPVTLFGGGSPTRIVNAVPIDPRIQAMVSTLTVNEALGTYSVFAVTAGTGAWNGDGTQHSDNAGNSISGGVNASNPSPHTTTKPILNDVTHPLWWSFVVANQDSVAHTGTVTLSFNCPPGVNYANCCPPDPLVEGELQQILQYVQAIYAAIPIPPNSFAEGTVHSGLVDAGSVTFTGLPLALKVQLTTIPSWVGVEVGDPDFYFDVGWLSFATSEGNYAQERLSLAEQVVTVPLLAGSVGYTLKNGVVASITELVAGP